MEVGQAHARGGGAVLVLRGRESAGGDGGATRCVGEDLGRARTPGELLDFVGGEGNLLLLS